VKPPEAQNIQVPKPRMQQNVFQHNYVKDFKQLQNLISNIHNKMKEDDKQKIRILGNDPQPLPSEWKQLEVMATIMGRKFPEFTPLRSGAHTYYLQKMDPLAQEYLRYVPEAFNPSSYTAISTTPDGRKCPITTKLHAQ
jgi:hypothetical protein